MELLTLLKIGISILIVYFIQTVPSFSGAVQI